MKDDYEKLYGEFLIKSITAEKEKNKLERRLYKVNYVIATASGCNKQCMLDWADYKKMTKRRAMIISGIIFGLIIFIILIC
jgi:ammonia channel protein AmtB